MQRQKYKISEEEYKIFKRNHLMNLIKNSDDPDRFGQAFLRYFPQIVEEYMIIGGDFGEAEAQKLWDENNIEQAEKIIKFWIK